MFRMSLGGIRDEAEIRGHRRTYIGSLPGKSDSVDEEGPKKVNPIIIVLMRLTKMGDGFSRGGPLLLHCLKY